LIVEALPAVKAVFMVAFGAPGAVIDVLVLPAVNELLRPIVVLEPAEVVLNEWVCAAPWPSVLLFAPAFGLKYTWVWFAEPLPVVAATP
jgi:hypothetical protein